MSDGSSRGEARHNSRKRLHRTLRLMANLSRGEAQMGAPGNCVRLIAHAICLLLKRRSVISQSIRLDDQSQLRPIEVDTKPVQPYLGPGHGQSGCADEAEKAPL